MYQVIDREILLSFDEMRILLYNMGFKSIRGILMPREEFRREEIIRSMHHMSLHGMICFTEEGFQIRPDLEELLRVIGEDKSDFILGPYADGSAFFCYAEEGRIIVTRRVWERKDMIGIRACSMEEFTRWREEKENDDRQYIGAHAGDLL